MKKRERGIAEVGAITKKRLQAYTKKQKQRKAKQRKQDTLDSIVEFLSVVGETPLLRARARLMQDVQSELQREAQN